MSFKELFSIKNTTLAYVGDAVFSLYVRAQLSVDPTIPTQKLMSRCCHIVSAVEQAKIYDKLIGKLSEDEMALMHRCENAHLCNKAKNATMREYKKATALEGLLGALYLTGDKARLDEILKFCMEIADE